MLSYKELQKITEEKLLSFIPESDEYSEVLYSACRYSLSSGGKRIRPVLLLAFNQMLGGKTEDALPFACALEFIHTYSLIHDDLPAMDNDDYRRGQPTNHKIFGEDIAILAGDALLTAAFGIISNANSLNSLKICSCISKCAYNMVRGQVADIGSDISELKDFDYIHKNKTAALFIAACECGGLSAGVSDADIEKIRRFGFCFGYAFQLADDILDFGEESKSNFANKFGIEKAKESFCYYLKEAVSIAEGFENNSAVLEICEMLNASVNNE